MYSEARRGVNWKGKIAAVDLRRSSLPRTSASAVRGGVAAVALFVKTMAILTLISGALHNDGAPKPTSAAQWI